MKNRTESKLCTGCQHSLPHAYITLWERRQHYKDENFVNFASKNFTEKVHCRMVSADAENFPFNIAKLSNWDEALLPKHCGHYTPRPKYLVFTKAPNLHHRWKFIGAYSTPELAEKVELNIPHPRVITNYQEFTTQIPKPALPTIADQLFVKIPLPDEMLTHEIVWDMLQLYQSDNDVIDIMNAHDWLRALFFKPGLVVAYEVMCRFGMYGILTMRGVIKDLRYEKYAKGPVIDIRPLKPWAVDYVKGSLPRGTKEREIDKKLYGNKLYIRVK